MDSANHELVTKSDLAVALAAMKAELKAEMKAEMHEQLEQQKFEMLERVEKVETTLLNEFRKWAVRLETHVKVHDLEISGLNQRLSFLEDQGDTPGKA